jgi:hypothetical protein
MIPLPLHRPSASREDPFGGRVRVPMAARNVGEIIANQSYWWLDVSSGIPSRRCEAHPTVSIVAAIENRLCEHRLLV